MVEKKKHLLAPHCYQPLPGRMARRFRNAPTTGHPGRRGSAAPWDLGLGPGPGMTQDVENLKEISDERKDYVCILGILFDLYIYKCVYVTIHNYIYIYVIYV